MTTLCGPTRSASQDSQGVTRSSRKAARVRPFSSMDSDRWRSPVPYESRKLVTT